MTEGLRMTEGRLGHLGMEDMGLHGVCVCKRNGND